MLVGIKTWTRQPPRLLLPIAEPYAAGLVGLVSGDCVGDHVVGGAGWTNTGPLVVNGLRGSRDISSGGHTTYPTPNWALQAPVSWFVVFAPTQHLTATGSHLEVNDRRFIQSRYSNSGRRYFTIATSGTSYSYENGFWSLTRPNRALLVWDGATAKSFIDGELMHSASCTGTISYGTFGYSNVRAKVQAGAVALAAIWQRALNDAEGRALTRNPWQLFEPRRIWVPVGAAGGPIEIAVGRADEGDDGIAPGATKIVAAGRADESSAALSAAALKTISGGQAAEANAALAPALTKVLAGARADEANQALAPGSTAAYDVGRAEEADQAVAPTLRKVTLAGRADEAAAALPLDLAGGFEVGFGLEADQALAPTVSKIAAVGRAEQSDVAVAPALVFALPVGLASQADHALALALVKIMAAGRSDELDAALALELDGTAAYPPPELLTITLPAEQRIRRLPAEQRIATLPPEARIIRIRS